MKKIVKVLLIVLMLTAMFGLSACNPDDGSVVTVNIAAPDGAPALALSKMIAANPAFEGYSVGYDVVMSDAATEAAVIIGNKLVAGDYDLAILPTNTAASLYNKSKDIKLLTVNTWGNLYVVSKEAELSSAAALSGEVIYVISQSGPPMAIIKYLLSQNGISVAEEDEYTLDANGFATPVAGKTVVRYMPATSMIPNLKQGKIKYGLLAEPAVTNAINVIGGSAKVVLDLQQEWKELTGADSYPQASLVVRTAFLNQNKGFVDAFVAELATQSGWIQDEANLDTIKQAITAKAEATALASMTAETVARCGVEVKTAAAAKTAVAEYLSLFGITVEDGFYYEG